MSSEGSWIIPTLSYKRAFKAMEWLEEAFGFERRLVVPGEEPGSVRHAQLVYGKGMVMIGSAREEGYGKWVGPPDAPNAKCTGGASVIVEDIEAHYRQAKSAGARILMPLREEGHGRGYLCHDIEGHVWYFGDYDPWAPVESSGR